MKRQRPPPHILTVYKTHHLSPQLICWGSEEAHQSNVEHFSSFPSYTKYVANPKTSAIHMVPLLKYNKNNNCYVLIMCIDLKVNLSNSGLISQSLRVHNNIMCPHQLKKPKACLPQHCCILISSTV